MRSLAHEWPATLIKVLQARWYTTRYSPSMDIIGGGTLLKGQLQCQNVQLIIIVYLFPLHGKKPTQKFC